MYLITTTKFLLSEATTYSPINVFAQIRNECNCEFWNVISLIVPLSLREELQRRPQFNSQRWHQCIKVPHVTCQRLYLQRLLFTHSESGFLYHTFSDIIMSGCRSFLWHPVLLLVTLHKCLLQRQESKEENRWESFELDSNVVFVGAGRF